MPEHALCSKEDKEYINSIKRMHCFKREQDAMRQIIEDHRKENGQEVMIVQTKLEQLMNEHKDFFDEYGGFKGKVFKQLLGFLAVHPVRGVGILKGVVTYAEEEVEMQGFKK